MSGSVQDILNSPALKKHKHVCAIFGSRDEAKELIGQFVAEGCLRGHKTMFLLDPDLAQEALQNLESNGVNVESARLGGVFELRVWKESYLKDPVFKSDDMVSFIDETMNAAHDQGHECIWAAGDMNWAGKNPENSEHLVAYEIGLNEIKPKFPDDIWICFYDASQFNGKVISDIIRAHPVVLMGSTIHENPFYTPPAEFLQELADWEKFKPSKSRAS